jgi:lysozyme family protein
MSKVDAIIEDVIKAEGGYVNDPADRGGETNWGITIAVARANGWQGAMRSMPRAFAEQVYRKRYIDGPGFAAILPLSEDVGAEVIDTGVNMGPAVAGRFLQRVLNAMNRQGRDWADISTDGAVGPATIAALRKALAIRGERIILTGLNALQGARYIELAEGRAANEQFLNGWLSNRVSF